MKDRAALIAEVNRQSQEFFDAISNAANAKAKELKLPAMQALANAIGTFAGAALAAIPPGQERDDLRCYIYQQMDASLKKHDGNITRCRTMNLDQLQ